VPVNEAQLAALAALGVKAKRLDTLKGNLAGVVRSLGDQVNNRDQLQSQIAALEVEIEQDYLAVRDL
jgi:septal ring factor EnvC (AmiA/AmiB activator)